jgi:phosphoadenosine phosphosulfate reductase
LSVNQRKRLIGVGRCSQLSGKKARKIELSLESLNKKFEAVSAHEIIAETVSDFWPHIAMSSSFQMQSLPLLHIVSQVAPKLPVIFLDTGYHFPETLVFRDQLARDWNLNLRIIRATQSQEALRSTHGQNLHSHNPDLCCYINKVEPMQRAMAGLQAWISGIRRDQSPTRANIQILEKTAQGIIRIHPMATWSRQDIWQYIYDHNLPEHPLLSQGYLSIGCAPCTRPLFAGEEERDGRWAGQDKLECGLHTLLRGAESDHQLAATNSTDDKE